jgi:hypothetical protein
MTTNAFENETEIFFEIWAESSPFVVVVVVNVVNVVVVVVNIVMNRF